METVSNIASAAGKAIWGEQNTTQGNETAGNEPISGVQGKGTVTDPYDQGNSENPIHSSSTKNTTDLASNPTLKTETANAPMDSSNVATGGHTKPLDNTASNPSFNTESANAPMSANNFGTGGHTKPHDHTGHTKPLDNTASNSTFNTESTNDPMSANNFGTGGHTKPHDHTGHTKPHDNTASNSTFNTESANAPMSSNNFGTGGHTNPLDSNPTFKAGTANAPINPNNAAAGGVPKPLENTEGTGVTGKQADPFKSQGSNIIPSESSNNPGAVPASGAVPSQKQQGADRPKDVPVGGAAGAIKESKNDAEGILHKRDPNDHSGEPMRMHDLGNKETPATQEERRESKIGLPGGQEHGKEEKGTGEQWIKTSGMQVDGGNFDATKPGAGREADRLMEEKGIKSESGNATAHDTSSADNGEKEKVPLGQKLKDKLHIGHKDK